MKLIKPSYEIVDIKPREIAIPDDTEIGPQMVKDELLNTAYRQIELAGRTCYKSEDKITRTSAKEFVDRMITSGHNAMLEFGTIYLKCPISAYSAEHDIHVVTVNPLEHYFGNKYSRSEEMWDEGSTTGSCYVTTNLRVLVENNWMSDLIYICEPTEFHEKRIHVKFTTDRGISHELVRHRVFSFAQESTRYCNYSKGKFDGELSFIIPAWWPTEPQTIPTGHIGIMDAHTIETMGRHAPQLHLIDMLHSSEVHYLQLIRNGMKPQDARQVLPNALKTEINMCGFESDWKHFFDLRDSSHAHPDMQALVAPLHKEFKDKKYA